MRIPEIAVNAGVWTLENGHRALLKLTGGRFPKRIMRMPTLELHTVGRRSGQPRHNWLTAPILEPERVVLIASKGGHPRHPDWYLNLSANPDIELTIDGVRSRWRARTATGEERAALWAHVTSVYRGYASYQANTDREIPVVVCEPADS